MKANTEAAAAQARAEARIDEMERIAKAVKADTHNISLYNECLNRYITSMQTSVSGANSYLDQSTLQQFHDIAMSTSLSQVCEQNSSNAKCLLICI